MAATWLPPAIPEFDLRLPGLLRKVTETSALNLRPNIPLN